MEKIILIGILLSTSCNIFAKNETTKGDAIDEICGNVGEYAESVMRSRQLGENIANSINVLNKAPKMAEPIRQYYKHIIYEAYKEPKWSTKENQDNAVTEFSNKMYLTCATAFQKELSDLD
ncbi:hypothetical protein [Acinetobacter sp. CS-2]|uniref:hypothetical protein n=1 Tax=Acinetobacter sp. CS-2 TaxID=2798861 RepID=UPI001902FCD6|nr:hypothetical protein [Acinetobacter sp. CS-2]QQN40790.1 hypothetical protein JFY49_07870 [Acinetobacter sp. CS-2]